MNTLLKERLRQEENVYNEITLFHDFSAKFGGGFYSLLAQVPRIYDNYSKKNVYFVKLFPLSSILQTL